MKKIAVILPTYKEEKNLQKIIPLIFKFLPQMHLVIVDDNSPDKTAIIVREFMKKYKNLHLIIRKKKEGRGSAILEGFKYALNKLHANLFIEMDADFSHSPEALPSLIAASGQKTIVIASRYLPESTISGWPLKRKVISGIANKLIQSLIQTGASDNTNGLRCYSKDAVKILLKHKFISRGLIVLSESLYILKKKGYKISEVPFDFRDRMHGTSNTSIKEFIEALFTLIRLRFSH